MSATYYWNWVKFCSQNFSATHILKRLKTLLALQHQVLELFTFVLFRAFISAWFFVIRSPICILSHFQPLRWKSRRTSESTLIKTTLSVGNISPRNMNTCTPLLNREENRTMTVCLIKSFFFWNFSIFHLLFNIPPLREVLYSFWKDNIVVYRVKFFERIHEYCY